MSRLNDTDLPRPAHLRGRTWVCTASGWSRATGRASTRHFYAGRWPSSGRTRSVEDRDRSSCWELQRARLDQQVRRARDASCPYYRDLEAALRDASDAREAIRDDACRSIPPLEKRAYRDQPEARSSSRDIPARIRLIGGRQTSGTTGTALPLWYAPETLAEEYATVWRLRRAFARRPEPGSDREPDLQRATSSYPSARRSPPFWRTQRLRRARRSVLHLPHDPEPTCAST